MTHCAICQNYYFQTGKLAKLGMGNCKQGPKYIFQNPVREHNCAMFKEVQASQMQARIDWEMKQVLP